MNRKITVASIVILTVLAAPLAYGLCFALWMTAYYRGSPAALRSWQVLFWGLLASLFVVCASDLYLVVKLIRKSIGAKTQDGERCDREVRPS